MAEVALLTRTTDQAPTSYALECLALIGQRYGLSLSVEQLVKDNRLGSAAVTTDQMLLCAERAGFRCRALRARWAALLDMQGALPAIVRLTDGRHAVLMRVDGHGDRPQVILQQPFAAEGETVATMERAAFEGIWSGDILLIKRSLGMAEKSRPFGLEAIVAMALGNRPLARDLAVSTAVLSVLTIAPVIFAQLLLTNVLSLPAVNTFAFLCLGMGLLILFEAGFVGVRRSLLGRLSARLEHDLSGYAFERLLHLPVDYFESNAIGLTAQRLAQVTTIAESLGSRAAGTALDAGLVVIAFPVMLYYNAILTFVVLGFCVLILGWILFVAPKIRRQTADLAVVEGNRSAFISQTMGGYGPLKSVALDAGQRPQLDVLTARATRMRLAESGTANTLQTLVVPLEGLMVFGTFALGIHLSGSDVDPSTLGFLFGFLLLTLRVAAPLRHVATLVRETEAFRSAVGLLGTLMNEPVEDGHAGHGVRLPLRGQIEFNAVTFTYPATATPALQSVSFDVPVGTTLGIMGRSGSGKTTIARLLQKFHADYQGLIKIDGIDARDYEVGHLRSSLGVVLQDTFLFSGSIRENITAAKPDATDDEVAHAARMAGADEFIDRLPLGYDTLLQESGVNLSDGERQRLSIARALIADPRILILDEATSALDPESEAKVNANLKRAAHGRTTITISHRFSALAQADMILVLDRGEVQDMGQHEELLERCDIYSGLWQRQKTLLDGPAAPETLLPRSSHVA